MTVHENTVVFVNKKMKHRRTNHYVTNESTIVVLHVNLNDV